MGNDFDKLNKSQRGDVMKGDVISSFSSCLMRPSSRPLCYIDDTDTDPDPNIGAVAGGDREFHEIADSNDRFFQKAYEGDDHSCARRLSPQSYFQTIQDPFEDSVLDGALGMFEGFGKINDHTIPGLTSSVVDNHSPVISSKSLFPETADLSECVAPPLMKSYTQMKCSPSPVTLRTSNTSLLIPELPGFDFDQVSLGADDSYEVAAELVMDKQRPLLFQSHEKLPQTQFGEPVVAPDVDVVTASTSTGVVKAKRRKDPKRAGAFPTLTISLTDVSTKERQGTPVGTIHSAVISLLHMCYCNNRGRCSFQGCDSNLDIVTHINGCVQTDCQVKDCFSVRATIRHLVDCKLALCVKCRDLVEVLKQTKFQTLDDNKSASASAVSVPAPVVKLQGTSLVSCFIANVDARIAAHGVVEVPLPRPSKVVVPTDEGPQHKSSAKDKCVVSILAQRNTHSSTMGSSCQRKKNTVSIGDTEKVGKHRGPVNGVYRARTDKKQSPSVLDASKEVKITPISPSQPSDSHASEGSFMNSTVSQTVCVQNSNEVEVMDACIDSNNTDVCVYPFTVDNESNEKACDPDQLRTVFLPMIVDMLRAPESAYFKEPVDYVMLNIPDYPELIREPMDLGTVKNKLTTGQYTSPWDVIYDVNLVFDNAFLYNKKNTRVHKSAGKLAMIFDASASRVMNQLGYCCHKRYVFSLQVLYCYSKDYCVIPCNSYYYKYDDKTYYCKSCFEEIRGSTFTVVRDDSSNPVELSKLDFKLVRNNEVVREPFVICVCCRMKFHKICVRHVDSIDGKDFYCSRCKKMMSIKRPENRYTSKNLPVSDLSSFIETRINDILGAEFSSCGHVNVRVICCVDKTVETKPRMLNKYKKEVSPYYPYRSRALFAFQEVEGVEVCFFSMHTQEYGKDCPDPNKLRVYLSYLDSVHYFQPKHLKTMLYHEIILSYLMFCKNKGFMYCHIWSCPPCEGDDYVFHCHSYEQRLPKPRRLLDWYNRMIEDGIRKNIILENIDMYKYFEQFSSEEISLKIPYFEGDYWASALEDVVAEHEKESNNTPNSSASLDKSKNKSQCRNKISKNRKSLSKKTTSEFLTINQRILSLMEKYKDVFFILRLTDKPCPIPESVFDPLVPSDLMDGRSGFLMMSRENHWEFSSFRHALYSTKAMLYVVHQQVFNYVEYTCDKCRIPLVDGYHCSTCSQDYDLCSFCYSKISHEHTMSPKAYFPVVNTSAAVDSKAPITIDVGSVVNKVTTVSSDANTPESSSDSLSNNNKLAAVLALIEHAVCCNSNPCQISSCNIIKNTMDHFEHCSFHDRDLCGICKQIYSIYLIHAGKCTKHNCKVPCCSRLQNISHNKRAVAEMKTRSRIVNMSIQIDTPDNSRSSVSSSRLLRTNSSRHSKKEEDQLLVANSSLENSCSEMNTIEQVGALTLPASAQQTESDPIFSESFSTIKRVLSVADSSFSPSGNMMSHCRPTLMSRGIMPPPSPAYFPSQNVNPSGCPMVHISQMNHHGPQTLIDVAHPNSRNHGVVGFPGGYHPTQQMIQGDAGCGNIAFVNQNIIQNHQGNVINAHIMGSNNTTTLQQMGSLNQSQIDNLAGVLHDNRGQMVSFNVQGRPVSLNLQGRNVLLDQQRIRTAPSNIPGEHSYLNMYQARQLGSGINQATVFQLVHQNPVPQQQQHQQQQIPQIIRFPNYNTHNVGGMFQGHQQMMMGVAANQGNRLQQLRGAYQQDMEQLAVGNAGQTVKYVTPCPQNDQTSGTSGPTRFVVQQQTAAPTVVAPQQLMSPVGCFQLLHRPAIMMNTATGGAIMSADSPSLNQMYNIYSMDMTGNSIMVQTPAIINAADGNQVNGMMQVPLNSVQSMTSPTPNSSSLKSRLSLPFDSGVQEFIDPFPPSNASRGGGGNSGGNQMVQFIVASSSGGRPPSEMQSQAGVGPHQQLQQGFPSAQNIMLTDNALQSQQFTVTPASVIPSNFTDQALYNTAINGQNCSR